MAVESPKWRKCLEYEEGQYKDGSRERQWQQQR